MKKCKYFKDQNLNEFSLFETFSEISRKNIQNRNNWTQEQIELVLDDFYNFSEDLLKFMGGSILIETTKKVYYGTQLYISKQRIILSLILLCYIIQLTRYYLNTNWVSSLIIIIPGFLIYISSPWSGNWNLLEMFCITALPSFLLLFTDNVFSGLILLGSLWGLIFAPKISTDEREHFCQQLAKRLNGFDIESNLIPLSIIASEYISCRIAFSNDGFYLTRMPQLPSDVLMLNFCNTLRVATPEGEILQVPYNISGSYF